MKKDPLGYDKRVHIAGEYSFKEKRYKNKAREKARADI